MTDQKLEQLRMLADWQLRELGYDPAKVTAACLRKDEDELARGGFSPWYDAEDQNKYAM